MTRRVSVLLVSLAVATIAVGASTSRPFSTQAAVHRQHSGLFPVTIRDDTGYRVTIPKKPRRIISLDPRDTETLFALDLSTRVVADGGSQDEGAFCCTKA